MKSEKKHRFILTRTFDAPVGLLWKMFTEIEHMGKWWGPKDVKVGYSKMDFRVGGIYLYNLVNPDGSKYWGKQVYREIEKPKKLVFVNAFSDEKGGLTRHPMSKTWPLELLTTFTFSEKDGKTEFTLVWEPINATEEEIKTFNAGHSSMTQGWTGSLDRLEGYLKEIQKKNKK